MENLTMEIKYTHFKSGRIEIETVEVKEEGIELVARMKCKVTNGIIIAKTSAFKNKNQFKKELSKWADTVVQKISDKKDMAAMEEGYESFLSLKKEAMLLGEGFSTYRLYERILKENQ